MENAFPSFGFIPIRSTVGHVFTDSMHGGKNVERKAGLENVTIPIPLHTTAIEGMYHKMLLHFQWNAGKKSGSHLRRPFLKPRLPCGHPKESRQLTSHTPGRNRQQEKILIEFLQSLHISLSHQVQDTTYLSNEPSLPFWRDDSLPLPVERG